MNRPYIETTVKEEGPYKIEDLPRISQQHCVPESLRLRLLNGNKGRIYFVNEGGGHSYYIPDESNLETLALNHEDNGFGRHLKLTVGQVLQMQDHEVHMHPFLAIGGRSSFKEYWDDLVKRETL